VLDASSMSATDINKLIKDLGWAKSELAQNLGVTPGTITHWGNGHARPNRVTIATMTQLRKRLDEAMNKNEKTELVDGLNAALVEDGTMGLMMYIFRKVG